MRLEKDIEETFYLTTLSVAQDISSTDWMNTSNSDLQFCGKAFNIYLSDSRQEVRSIKRFFILIFLCKTKTSETTFFGADKGGKKTDNTNKRLDNN